MSIYPGDYSISRAMCMQTYVSYITYIAKHGRCSNFRAQLRETKLTSQYHWFSGSHTKLIASNVHIIISMSMRMTITMNCESVCVSMCASQEATRRQFTARLSESWSRLDATEMMS